MTFTYTMTTPSGGYLSQIVPLPTTTPGKADFLLLWNWGLGETELPPQVVQMDITTGAGTDITAAAFDGVAPPLMGNPRGATLFSARGAGGTYVLIAEQGLDKTPWYGAQQTLLKWDGAGHFTDASSALASPLSFAHSLSSGVINAAGDIGALIDNVGGASGTMPRYYIENAAGHLTDVSNELPVPLQTLAGASYTGTLFAPLTNSGISDLIIGTINQVGAPSAAFLNPGNGDFSKATAILLPPSPLANTPSFYSSMLSGASVMDIQPIHISSNVYVDLVVVSITANANGYAIQILINDGTGHFTDQTATRLLGAPSLFQPDTLQSTDIFGNPWLIHGWVADVNGDGFSDIVTSGKNNAPSQVFMNNGKGVFNFAYAAPSDQFLQTPATIGGVTYLIEENNGVLTFLPVSTAHLAAQSATLSAPMAGQLYLYGAGAGAAKATALAQSYDTTVTLNLHGAYTAGTAHTVDVKINGVDLGVQSLSSALGFTYQGHSFTSDQTLTFKLAGMSAISTLTITQDSGAEMFVGDVQINGVDLGAANNWSGNSQSVDASAWNKAFDKTIGTAANPIQVTGSGPSVTAHLLGAAAQYTVTGTGTSTLHLAESAGLNQNAVLTNVSQVQFSDYTLVFDLHSSQDKLVYELYQAAYGRTPDNSGFRYWAGVADANSSSALSLADDFLGASEFTQLYGANPTNSTYVTGLYTHVLGRTPDTGGLAYWVGQADAGMARDALLVAFSTSNENVALIGAHTANGLWTT